MHLMELKQLISDEKEMKNIKLKETPDKTYNFFRTAFCCRLFNLKKSSRGFEENLDSIENVRILMETNKNFSIIALA